MTLELRANVIVCCAPRYLLFRFFRLLSVFFAARALVISWHLLRPSHRLFCEREEVDCKHNMSLQSRVFSYLWLYNEDAAQLLKNCSSVRIDAVGLAASALTSFGAGITNRIMHVTSDHHKLISSLWHYHCEGEDF